ncbi:MAG: hypothetical protein AAF684_09410 [Pseudomonadota bacterium]
MTIENAEPMAKDGPYPQTSGSWANAAAAAARRIGSSGEPISPIEAQARIARAADALRRTG